MGLPALVSAALIKAAATRLEAADVQVRGNETQEGEAGRR